MKKIFRMLQTNRPDDLTSRKLKKEMKKFEIIDPKSKSDCHIGESQSIEGATSIGSSSSVFNVGCVPHGDMDIFW
ncbi:MAG: hypothetical protein ACR2PH_02675, partial [Desulfobulbia bacterium]